MKNTVKALCVLFLILAIACPFSSISCSEQRKEEKPKAKDDIFKQVELFGDAVGIVRSDYVDEVDSKKLMYGALKGMLGSLDDFTQFMEPEEYNELKEEAKGEFGGIGVEISFRDGILTIISPIAGTPADVAGIKAGDKIVKIDNKITKNISMNDAIKMMRGAPGTMVTLTVWREKDQKILPIQIKRDTIKIRSIRKAELIDGHTGYIRLVEFQENTPKDLEEALKKLESEGMDALILDLRNNPGGLLDTAVDVSEKFLPKDKVIVSLKSRTPEQNAVFKSKGRFQHPDYPLIVMVNEGSASASEIVAGAVQDNKRGMLLGTKTFGKASVQTVIPLRDGSAMKLTTASYYTPSGKMIRNQGIIPDIVVEREENGAVKLSEDTDIFEKLEEKEKKLPIKEKTAKEKQPERDNQLDRAVDLIKGIKIYRADKIKA